MLPTVNSSHQYCRLCPAKRKSHVHLFLLHLERSGLFTIRCNSFTCKGNTRKTLWTSSLRHEGSLNLHMFFRDRLSRHIHIHTCVSLCLDIALMCQVSLKCWLRHKIFTLKDTKNSKCTPYYKRVKRVSNVAHHAHCHFDWPYLAYATSNNGTKETWNKKKFL